jgi:Fic family protein
MSSDRRSDPILLPAHREEVRPWSQRVRGGVKEDRMMREVAVSMPPLVADLRLTVPPGHLEGVQQSIQAVTWLDRGHGDHLAALAALLLRAESVASSKIERVEASKDDYARAFHGHKGNASATSMVASTRALHDLITSVDGGHPIAWQAVLEAHEVLMRDDLAESDYAGRIRDMQNWIGGSDYSPRAALFVPPPPETLPKYIEDLMIFVNRTDIDVFLQAAVAHAQFESIHPFTDGNGRIGRALINAILRRRGVTTRVVVPLASAMVADRERYFRALDLYRLGDGEYLLLLFQIGSLVASVEASATAGRLEEMRKEWIEEIRPRSGSVLAETLAGLFDHPVFTAAELRERLGRSESVVYGAIAVLVEAGILRRVDRKRRDQIWVAAPLADELDDLNRRIEGRVRGLWQKGDALPSWVGGGAGDDTYRPYGR